MIALMAPQTDVLTFDTERLLCQSGQGGGKTAVMGIMSGLLALTCPSVLGMVGANTYGQLSDATLSGILNVWEQHFGWKEGIHYVSGILPPAHFKEHKYNFTKQTNKIFLYNGAVIFTYSMDAYKAIEGVEVGWIMLDETKHTKEEAIKTVLIARLRQRGLCKRVRKKGEAITADNLLGFVPASHPEAGEQRNPLMIFTSPEKEQWLTSYFKLYDYKDEIRRRVYSKTDYFYHSDGFRTIILYSSWHNKYTNSTTANLEKELTKDRAALQVYADPFGKSGAEYYANYDVGTHEGDYNYNSNAALRITYDFNTAPYMTLRVWQIVYNSDHILAQCIDEYLLKAPRNTIEAVTLAFLDDYQHLIFDYLYVYADASGKNSIPIADVKSFISVIRKVLKKQDVSYEIRLLKQNPRHNSVGKNKVGRRDFINKLLKGVFIHEGFPVRVRFSRSASKGNSDYDFVMEDANGAKLKKKVDIDGIKCEPYGHASDADDALLCYEFGDFKKDRKIIGTS